MRKSCLADLLCVAMMLFLFAGCSATEKKSDVQLTQAQVAAIDLLVQNRDDWKETSAYISIYPVNRIHVSEVSDGVVVLTVAYVETGTTEGSQIFAGVRGYAVKEDVFTPIEGYHEDWLAGCTTVDLENMSDDELREALKESYINFLSKE